MICSLPANSKNGQNFIKVKLNHKLFQVNPKQNYVRDSCWILEPKSKDIAPKVTISAVRKHIITSIKKYK